MEDAALAGGLAEVLLLLRPLVDEAVASIKEGEMVDAPVTAFQAAIHALAAKEPDVWQLRVVEHIYAALGAQGAQQSDVQGGKLDAGVKASEALERATMAVCKRIRRATVELQYATDKAVRTPTETEGGADEGGSEGGEAFMQRFWLEMSAMLSAAESFAADQEEEGEAGEQADSVEILAFDDEFHDDDQSGDSTPTAECVPSLSERMQGDSANDRAAALNELTQVPVFELLHCSTSFPETVRSIVGLFLDEDVDGFDVAHQAKRLLYQLLSECEDPLQFLDVYWAVVAFLGHKLSAGDLFLSKYTALEAADPASIRVVDTFRVLRVLLERLPFHWIHFSPEMLAKVFWTTFHVLNMYSKLDVDVDVAFARPLAVLGCLDEYPKWLRSWLLKAPSRCQLFMALEDTGVVADALQQLSSLQPVAEAVGGPVNGTEQRLTAYLLGVVALVSEYAVGRELVQRWRCLSVHEQLRSRVSTFNSVRDRDLVAVEGENNRLFRLEGGNRTARPKAGENPQQDVLAGVVWCTVSVVLLDSESSQGAWEANVLASVARVVAQQGMEEPLVSLLQVLHKCIRLDDELGSSPPPHSSDYFSWRPLREPRSPPDASQLLYERILTTTLGQSVDSVRTHSRSIVEALLSSRALTDRLTSRFSSAVSPLFPLWQDLLVTSIQEATRCPSTRVSKRASIALRVAPHLLVLMRSSELENLASSMLSLSRTFSERKSGGVGYTAALVAIGSTASGFQALNSVNLITEWSKPLVEYLMSQAPAFHDVTSLTTRSRDVLRAFFSSDFVSDGLSQGLIELRELGDSSMAVSSSFDECPPSLRLLIHRYSIIRYMLTTRFAPDVILKSATEAQSAVTNFIRGTLRGHGTGCRATSDAEDTCCVAFQLLTALVSSIPAKIACCELLSELGLLKLDGKGEADREPLAGLGACSYLELKLRYELASAGGATERMRWCDLYKVDAEMLERAATSLVESQQVPQDEQTRRGQGTASLNGLKLKAIVELEASQVSCPPGSGLQLVWELIGELERHGDSRIVTSMLGAVVMAVAKSEVGSPLFPTASSSPRALEADQFPPTMKRKMLNRLYKSYCLKLGLSSSPTKLHSVLKQFGNAAVDCFPVTMLMLLGDACADDQDLLRVLSRLYDSPASLYLWPATATLQRASVATVVLPEAVEWVLAREFPQVLHSIRLCKCSVAVLVTRWQSQSFWNYLDWGEIATLVTLTMLYGVDFQVHAMVAMLAHIEPEARRLGAKHSMKGLEALLELQELPIAGFSFFTWKNELLRLRAKHRDQVTRTLSGH